MDSLNFLYNNAIGRCFLKVLISRPVSALCGAFLNTGLSKKLIDPFVEKNNIDLSDYDMSDINCFNDFFCRRILPGKRIIDKDPDHLIAPCDGLLSVYSIKGDTVFPIKQSRYRIEDLLNNRKLAEGFNDGIILIFRLCVDNYHRYSYIDSGVKTGNRFIAGKLHTVRPIALRNVPVFIENCREYTMIKTDNFGSVIQMEVGAMLVGKINNYHGKAVVSRGQEKGRFLYGGSTVIVLLKKDKADILPELMINSGREVPVVMGQYIGNRR